MSTKTSGQSKCAATGPRIGNNLSEIWAICQAWSKHLSHIHCLLKYKSCMPYLNDSFPVFRVAVFGNNEK